MNRLNPWLPLPSGPSTVTVAPFTPAPLTSFTVPEIDASPARWSDCADITEDVPPVTRAIARINGMKTNNILFIKISFMLTSMFIRKTAPPSFVNQQRESVTRACAVVLFPVSSLLRMLRFLPCEMASTAVHRCSTVLKHTAFIMTAST